MLPENNTPWPPVKYERALDHMAEWSAWYSGDPDQLTDHYTATPAAKVRPSQQSGGVVGKVARWWWGTPAQDGEARTKLHVPLAADLCGTSADLLFSEPVKLTAESESLQEFLDGLQDAGLDAKLHEAAEVTAALGGGYLRTCWNKAVGPTPWTDTVHADMALPEFRWGRLHAVNFWQRLTPLSSDTHTVWRLVERHQPGAIVHTLFKGREDNLGIAVPLEDHPDAEHLAKLVDANGGVATGVDRLTATYVPNMYPNRRDRGSRQGRSDLQGVEPMLDALDEAYSSWWRDIRHGKSRIHVPASYLDVNGPGQPGSVSLDREVYVPLEGVMAKPGEGLAIDAHQFKIRVAEHAATCKEWTDRIIESAGYSTQSLSSDTGGAVTATEVHAHERRSYMTRGKKERYWKAGILDHLVTMAEVANANLSGGLELADLAVEFEDGVQDSVASIAQTAQLLRNAEAASADTRVRMVHPEWDDKAVAAEVALILAESGGHGEPVPMPDDAGL